MVEPLATRALSVFTAKPNTQVACLACDISLGANAAQRQNRRMISCKETDDCCLTVKSADYLVRLLSQAESGYLARLVHESNRLKVSAQFGTTLQVSTLQGDQEDLIREILSLIRAERSSRSVVTSHTPTGCCLSIGAASSLLLCFCYSVRLNECGTGIRSADCKGSTLSQNITHSCYFSTEIDACSPTTLGLTTTH